MCPMQFLSYMNEQSLLYGRLVVIQFLSFLSNGLNFIYLMHFINKVCETLYSPVLIKNQMWSSPSINEVKPENSCQLNVTE